MAIITCPECKEKISSSAKSCSKCGKPLGNQGIPLKYIFWALIILVFAVSSKFGGKENKPPKEATVQSQRQEQAGPNLQELRAAREREERAALENCDKKAAESVLRDIQEKGIASRQFDPPFTVRYIWKANWYGIDPDKQYSLAGGIGGAERCLQGNHIAVRIHAYGKDVARSTKDKTEVMISRPKK
jgi:hypothetical protein